MLWIFPLPIVYQNDLDANETGSNASSSALTIEIAQKVEDVGSKIGILAQELFEFQYKWKHLQFFYNGEELELMGHSVETYVAHTYDGKDYDDYESLEAQAIARPNNSYHAKGLFKDWTYEKIVEELKKRRPAAKAWADAHVDVLNKLQKKFCGGK